MLLNPYLTFDGQCEAAFRFYADCLGGTVTALARFGEAPQCDEVLTPEQRDRIMHARLAVGDQVLMGSDTTPEHPYEGIHGCAVSLNVDSVAEAERIFTTLAEGGTVQMRLAQTFWAARFGMCVDRFGVPWMINCEQNQ
ncbi:VOC family protein [Azoarcus sp. PA01]|nr:VOC family protein [Azoarcus sp. PA01]